MKTVLKNLLIISVFALVMYAILNDIQKTKNTETSEVTFYELQNIIRGSDKQVELVQKENGILMAKIKNQIYITTIKPDSELVDAIISKENVIYHYQEQKNIIELLLTYGIPILILIFILAWLFGEDKGEKATKTQSKKAIQKLEKPEMTLADVGGLNEEVKMEIKQIIEIFKNKDEAIEMGIKPAKGVILYGPPGTGKTSLAKAIANGLDATFYSTSGSAFSEMFVGVGSSRVRELFEEARKNAPSLIFIDEIDSVAKKRGTASSHEERENTLNELLKQMDGVESNEGVFVVAATNRLDMLDEAILRPGRFDHKILINYPDVEGRREIIAIHSKNKKLDENVTNKLDKIAEETIGYTGAELENLFNLAAKKAMLKDKKEISMDEINEAIDATILGNKNKPIKDEKVLQRVAYHEAGHALIRAVLNPGQIRKATIIPRGQALGYVATTPKEMELSTKSELIGQIAMILGGGIAEIKKFGEHSIGVSGDVQQAKNIIDKMIEVGMKENTFKLSFKEEDENEWKEKIYNEAKEIGEKIINEHEKEWEKIAELLMTKETVEGQEIQDLIQ